MAFARFLQNSHLDNNKNIINNNNKPYPKIRILVGHDPRPHGRKLLNSLCRGINAATAATTTLNTNTTVTAGTVVVVEAYDTGLASTPACAAAVLKEDKHNDNNLVQSQAREDDRKRECRYDAAIMITASHLPVDRNGFKFFLTNQGGITTEQLHSVNNLTQEVLVELYYQQQQQQQCISDKQDKVDYDSINKIDGDVTRVEYMPMYTKRLKCALIDQVKGLQKDNAITSAEGNSTNNNYNDDSKILSGLNIVVNAGHGSGGLFAYNVLHELGANVSGSIHLDPDSNFPQGVPNPENSSMMHTTIKACQDAQADLGILFDTDADRCGFVVPRTVSTVVDETGCSVFRTNYEPLHRNRLIALLAVVLARDVPGCTVVTDSVTSEGLTLFLQELGLVHVRYVKGYANVINKAKEVDAELAIETSGHCAMKENAYLDDGTYTAVKVVSLLAREQKFRKQESCAFSLLNLIDDLKELDEIVEFRITTKDGSLETMRVVFDLCAQVLEELCNEQDDRELDTENLEGIRVRTGRQLQFVMLRKSLHDPLLSIQVEARSRDEARRILAPIIQAFDRVPQIQAALDMKVLREY